MGYRETFFNNTPSMMGNYQCVKCRGWFPKSQIDVDHRVPKRQGGTDDLWNLQAMCKHCNRSKGAKTTGTDIAQTAILAGVSGLMNGGIEGGVVNLTRMGKSVAKRKVQDAFGIKYKR